MPTREREDALHASRGLTTLQAERTRYRNRIHSLLALHGVGRLRLDGQFPDRLLAVRDWAGAPLPPGVQTRLRETWTLLHQVEAVRQQARCRERQQVRASATTPGTPAQRLARVRGIAARSATVLAEELFSRGLRNRRGVGALTGLVSAPYRSETSRATSVSPSTSCPLALRPAFWRPSQVSSTTLERCRKRARESRERRSRGPQRHRDTETIQTGNPYVVHADNARIVIGRTGKGYAAFADRYTLGEVRCRTVF